MSKAKRWCYTINNPTEEPSVPEEEFSYHVYGEETGDSGTLHYQGFIIFKTPKRLNQIRNLISDRGHYEVAKGKNKQAADYCKKTANLKNLVKFLKRIILKVVRPTKSVTSALSSKLKQVILTLLTLTYSLSIIAPLNKLKQTMSVIYLHSITYLAYGYMVVQELVNRNMHVRPTRAPTSKTATSGGTTIRMKRMLLSMTLTILTLASAIILNGGGTIMLSLLRPKADLFISVLSGLW